MNAYFKEKDSKYYFDWLKIWQRHWEKGVKLKEDCLVKLNKFKKKTLSLLNFEKKREVKIDITEKRILKRFGHLHRMNEERCPRQLFTWKKFCFYKILNTLDANRIKNVTIRNWFL